MCCATTLGWLLGQKAIGTFQLYYNLRNHPCVCGPLWAGRSAMSADYCTRNDYTLTNVTTKNKQIHSYIQPAKTEPWEKIEIDYYKRETEPAIKNHPIKKTLGTNFHWSILHNSRIHTNSSLTVPKTGENRTLPNSFCKDSLIPKQNPDEDNTRKQNYRPISWININAKTSVKWQ